jgi:hypothetical protein
MYPRGIQKTLKTLLYQPYRDNQANPGKNTRLSGHTQRRSGSPFKEQIDFSAVLVNIYRQRRRI